ncbi:ALF repeat-containing protein (plasmid) [Kitasatospora purpeofusca]|nr:ALF repeat-containing protein [Kitasatospora purpeofusca]
MEDYRSQVLRIMNDGGRAVKKAGSAAMDAKTAVALRDFLAVGQHRAREEDDRDEVLHAISTGGHGSRPPARWR